MPRVVAILIASILTWFRSRLPMQGAVLARRRDRGEAVEQVVATIWTAIEQVQVDTASDASSEAR